MFVRKFSEFINENLNSKFNKLEVIFDGGSHDISIKYGKSGTIFRLSSVQTVNGLIRLLERLQTKFRSENSSAKLVADGIDMDGGIGLDLTLPNGSYLAGPDFGMCKTVGEAISEISKFMVEMKAGIESLTEDDLEDQPFVVIHIN